MRIHRHRRYQRQTEDPHAFRWNEKIRVPELRIIDEKGESVGVMPTAAALAMARERGLDLIEVAPKAQPPVAKFLSYKSYKYEQEKAARQQKAHAKRVEVKGIRLSLRIGEHDRSMRIEKAKEFFAEGNRIAVEIILRGRERQHGMLAREIIQKFVNELRKDHDLAIDQPLTVQGGRFSLVVGGKLREAGAQAKRDKDAELDEETDEE